MLTRLQVGTKIELVMRRSEWACHPLVSFLGITNSLFYVKIRISFKFEISPLKMLDKCNTFQLMLTDLVISEIPDIRCPFIPPPVQLNGNIHNILLLI